MPERARRGLDVAFATNVGFATRGAGALRAPRLAFSLRMAAAKTRADVGANWKWTMTESNELEALLARLRAEQDVLVEIACVLRNRLLREGLSDVCVPSEPQRCSLQRDPCDGSRSLVGEWHQNGNRRVGSLVIHENGQLYAERDVFMPLPRDTSLLVDAVVVFGSAGELHSELRLTPREL